MVRLVLLYKWSCETERTAALAHTLSKCVDGPESWVISLCIRVLLNVGFIMSASISIPNKRETV